MEYPDLHGRHIAVFCGSRSGANDYRMLARDLGQSMAHSGATLIYGGGRSGLMDAVCEGILEHGGQAIGVLPTFMDANGWASARSTRTVITDDMHLRKAWMESHADAFIILPGGLGTLDELATVMTTRQLEQHAKPILLLDPDDYYDPLIQLFEHMITHGFIEPGLPMPYHAKTPHEALEWLAMEL
jgi:uncharacterized protein (TIGR00730 family)